MAAWPLPLPSSKEMAAFDADAIAASTSSEELIERAGKAVFQTICKYYNPAKVLVLCGSGNNGRDGAVIARYFKEAGRKVVQASKVSDVSEADLIVDALLGTGQNGPPRGEVGEILKKIPKGITIVSVDMPTGINADTGEVYTNAIRADLTVAIQFIKRGMLQSPAREHCGKIEVVDIGINQSRLVEFNVLDNRIAKILKPRERNSHKGSFGKVLIVGGSETMPGAPALSSLGALKSGAGIVVRAVLSKAHLENQLLEEMIVPLEGSHFSSEHLAHIKEALNNKDALILGPGLGRNNETMQFVRELIGWVKIPTVLDADGLISGVKVNNGIITPHPGESARLLGVSVSEVERDRYGAVKALYEKTGALVILKGASSIVWDGKRGYVNTSGNPWMATPGSGDVLAGCLGAFLALGYQAFEAAALSVYLHGRAGDLASITTGSSILASEIALKLSEAIGELQC